MKIERRNQNKTIKVRINKSKRTATIQDFHMKWTWEYQMTKEEINKCWQWSYNDWKEWFNAKDNNLI